jgi:hypothetical protein
MELHVFGSVEVALAASFLITVESNALFQNKDGRQLGLKHWKDRNLTLEGGWGAWGGAHFSAIGITKYVNSASLFVGDVRNIDVFLVSPAYQSGDTSVQ